MTKDIRIQYITDENGEKTAAVIPISEWLEYSKFLEEYITVKESIRRGLDEIKAIKSGEAIPQSVDSFLDEL